MTVDYDAPRRPPVEVEDPSLDELAGRRTDASAAASDVDEAETAESYVLPGADLSDEEFTVRVVPLQADEFTCASCFLVHHRNRLAPGHSGATICTDCA